MRPTTLIPDAKRWNFSGFGLPYDQVSYIAFDGSLTLQNGIYGVISQMVVSVVDANPVRVSISRNEPTLASLSRDPFYMSWFNVTYDHGKQPGNVLIPFNGILNLC